MNKQIVKQCVRNADREGYITSNTLSKQEISALELEASQPALPTKKSLEEDLRLAKDNVEDIQMQLLRLKK